MSRFKKSKFSKFRKVWGFKISKVFNLRKKGVILITEFSIQDPTYSKFNEDLEKVGGMEVEPLSPPMPLLDGKESLFIGEVYKDINLNYKDGKGEEHTQFFKKGEMIKPIITLK